MYKTGERVMAIENIPCQGIKIGDEFEIVSVSSFDGNLVIGAKNDGGVVYVSDVFLKDIDATGPNIYDEVYEPPHYTHGGIEVIDYIEAKLTPEQFEGYLLGNVIKYTSRAGKKFDKVGDLKKAQVYLGWLVERCGGGE